MASSALASLVDTFVFAAGDAMGAAAGVAALRALDLPVAGVSGLLTACPLATREARAALDVPVFTLEELFELPTVLAPPGACVRGGLMSTIPRTLADGRWRTLALLVANGVCQAAAAVAAAVAAERVFELLTAPVPGSVVGPAVALVAAALATAGLRGRERVDAERLGQAYTHRLRLHLFKHLTSMSPRTVQNALRAPPRCASSVT